MRPTQKFNFNQQRHVMRSDIRRRAQKKVGKERKRLGHLPDGDMDTGWETELSKLQDESADEADTQFLAR